MHRNPFRTIGLTLACVVAGLFPSLLSAQTAYAVTATGQLARFNLATPGTLDSSVAITGLGGGETIVGIDFRPATGQLYALGSLSRMYAVDPGTGAATQVGANGAFTLGGAAFGVDFNPAADRLRVVSDAEQNLRLNPATGAIAATDVVLAYAVGDINQGQNPSVAGSAYTSNFAGTISTTLYGIDANLDVLVTQNPPNSGTLNTVGSLGVLASTVMGFDIISSAGVDTAYAALQVGGSSRLYRISLTTGIATLVGNFPGGTTITGLAIRPDPPRLSNISTRGQVLTGNDVMIGGFVVGGSLPKTIVVRARGPSLIPFGIPNALLNPQLQLVRSSDQVQVGFNDDWQTAANAGAVTASGFAPSNSLESAILVNLPPGAYTAILSGVGNLTGVGIVEVFEVDAPIVPLTNISTRGQVLTGNEVMIGGFVVSGTAPQTVVVRARGPSLVPFGIPNALANPQLQLVRSSDQVQVAFNDDWQSASNAAAITASGFAPSNSLESAILVSLPPGGYTAIVTGVVGGTGVGIVEVFTTP